MRKSKIKNYWITPDMAMDWEPCRERWSDEKVLAWFNGRKRVRLKTILKDESISRADRYWVIDAVHIDEWYKSQLPKTWWASEFETQLDDIIAKIE